MPIAPASTADARDLASLHARAFPDSFLTRLGQSFLLAYYSECAVNSRAECWVVRDDSECVGSAVVYLPGFAVQGTDVVKTMNPSSAALAFLRTCRSPRGLLGLAENLLQSRLNRPELPNGTCYLASLAVSPQIQGQGVGRTLLHHVTSTTATQNLPFALEVSADRRDAAYRLYQTAGFSPTDSFRRLDGQRRAMLIRPVPHGTPGSPPSQSRSHERTLGDR